MADGMEGDVPNRGDYGFGSAAVVVEIPDDWLLGLHLILSCCFRFDGVYKSLKRQARQAEPSLWLGHFSVAVHVTSVASTIR